MAELGEDKMNTYVIEVKKLTGNNVNNEGGTSKVYYDSTLVYAAPINGEHIRAFAVSAETLDKALPLLIEGLTDGE